MIEKRFTLKTKKRNNKKSRQWGRALLIALCCCFGITAHAESPANFTQAKKWAATLFQTHSITLYCHCRYEDKEINLDSCGMSEASNKKRAHRLEWEHMMAAEHFGQQLACWREPLCTTRAGKSYKGRACCAHQDETFRHMESELYNLWPSVGLINQARSNYRFAMLPGHSRYAGCEISIDKEHRRVEPADSAKGIIARAHLFMASHYTLSLSPSQRALFNAWNNQFPPTAWEYKWANQVSVIEGYDNPFITQYDKTH